MCVCVCVCVCIRTCEHFKLSSRTRDHDIEASLFQFTAVSFTS